MQAKNVLLPPGEFITLSDLVKALADATFTEKLTDLKGRDCVVGKWVVPSKTPTAAVAAEGKRRATYSDVLEQSNNGERPSEPSPALPPSHQSADRQLEEDIGFPYLLTKTDHALLNRLIPGLPPLDVPISKETATAFLEAFKAHKDFPGWLPRLISDSDIQRREYAYEALRDRYRTMLKKEAEAGRLLIRDDEGVPLLTFTITALIFRPSAIDFLLRYGFSVPEKDLPGAGPGADAPSGKRLKKKKPGEVWTDEELKLVDRFLASEDARTGKKITISEAARQLEMSRKNVHTLMKKIEEMRVRETTMWSQLMTENKKGG